MNIQFTQNTNFKGYDARPVKGFLMSSNSWGIANEMRYIGEKEGFKVYSLIENDYGDIRIADSYCPFSSHVENLWAQDKWTIFKNKLFSHGKDLYDIAIRLFFDLIPDETQESKRKHFIKNTHIKGGNFFIVNNNDKREVLIGKNELNNFSYEEISKMFETNKVVILPQMDMHIDLFVRPLDNKRILIADDEMTLSVIKDGIEKVKEKIKNCSDDKKTKYIEIADKLQNAYDKFKIQSSNTNFAKIEETEEILKNSGYEVIRVPARIYNLGYDSNEFLSHDCNYINAQVIKKDDGSLVYITNKSDFDTTIGITPEIAKELDFSFENGFVKSISKYINKDKIYFVNGEFNFISDKMLRYFQGGIHCASSEIPFEF